MTEDAIASAVLLLVALVWGGGFGYRAAVERPLTWAAVVGLAIVFGIGWLVVDTSYPAGLASLLAVGLYLLSWVVGAFVGNFQTDKHARSSP